MDRETALAKARPNGGLDFSLGGSRVGSFWPVASGEEDVAPCH